MAESKMADFKMAAIFKLSQKECEWSFFVQMVGTISWQVWVSLRGKTKMARSQEGLIQDDKIQRWLSIIKLSDNEWVWVRLNYFESEPEWSESVFLSSWNKITRCLNPRWQVSEYNMAEVKMAAIIKLSQNEWVMFFCAKGGNQSWQVWVSLKENTKMAESKMARIQDGRIQDSCHHQVKMRMNEFESDWISLSQNQSRVRVFLSQAETR